MGQKQDQREVSAMGSEGRLRIERGSTKVKLIKGAIGLGLMVGVGAAVMPLASYGAPLASDAVSGNTMQVTIDGSITITEVDNQALDLELSGGDISSGTPAIGQHLVRVALSVPGGYTLSMESDSASLLREGATTGVFDGTGDTTGGF
ncbi:hypothetical protein FWG76_02580, partial [Candidatus Saccharibacteria bacterium]|nr:hypothetical protein [Candidatus Saccharibacteria bacterium]